MTILSFIPFSREYLSRVDCTSNFRVIVGAPEDDSEQAKVGIEKAGAVYRCQTQMPFRCDQIPFDTSGKIFQSILEFEISRQIFFPGSR